MEGCRLSTIDLHHNCVLWNSVIKLLLVLFSLTTDTKKVKTSDISVLLLLSSLLDRLFSAFTIEVKKNGNYASLLITFI